jgi:hypothetical protein
VTAAALAASALLSTGLARADDGAASAVTPPPYVQHTEWVHWNGRTSLRVYPTPAGRTEARVPGSDAEAAEAWNEVIADAPDADLPSMRAQFLCHWHWAEIVEPGKTSWNIEPWRPVVDDAQMITSGCNPAGPEEPF